MNDSHDSGAGAIKTEWISPTMAVQSVDPRPTIAVDFDGVIYTGKWEGSDKPLDPNAVVPGAKEGIAALREKFRVVIFSCRSYTGRTAYGDYAVGHAHKVADWLKDRGIEVDEVTTFPGKIAAAAYIDDKAINFSGDWFATVTAATSFRSWNSCASKK